MTDIKTPETPFIDAVDTVANHLDMPHHAVYAMIAPARNLLSLCHAAAVTNGWWSDLETGEAIERNKGEMYALMHSEISEGMEGMRKGRMDDHLPHRTNEEVELADAMIRIADYAEAHDLDIVGAMIEKLAVNASRPDHKPENRRKEGGKKF